MFDASAILRRFAYAGRNTVVRRCMAQENPKIRLVQATHRYRPDCICTADDGKTLKGP